MKFRLIHLPLTALLAVTLEAEVRPNPLFSECAVLQRGQKIPVWGTARVGEEITVEFQGQRATTTAAVGTWPVHLDPLTAGDPFTMTFTGDNTVAIKDLFVGEVWICSGQCPVSKSDLTRYGKVERAVFFTSGSRFENDCLSDVCGHAQLPRVWIFTA